MISFGSFPANLAPHIIIGYCDADGSSLRTLFSLDASPGCTITSHAIEIGGLTSGPCICPAFVGSADQTQCMAVKNILSGSSEPLVSLITINVAIEEESQALFISTLLGKLPANSTVIIPASAPIQGSNSLRPFSITLPPFPKSRLPPLPPTLPLQDNFLALLHHLTTASGIRARFILTPGYRPAVGEEGAQESISNAAKLAKALMDELSDVGCSALKVDEGKAALLKLNKSWFGVKAQQDLLYF